jgi:superfamily II DNA or RNA helicase
LEEEADSRRILYLDTLKMKAKGKEIAAVQYLAKLHIRLNANRSIDTLSFQEIILPPASSSEAIRIMAETGRLFFRSRIVGIGKKRSLFWKGQSISATSAIFQGFIDENALENVELLFAGWAIDKGEWFEIETPVDWKWIERFCGGQLLLQGPQKKKFLEERPAISWEEKGPSPFEVLPQLVLSDASGVCANLWMIYTGGFRIAFEDLKPEVGGRGRLRKEEAAWEKDLVEAGYMRKVVGNSHYYCPGEKRREALCFLLEVGWTCFDMRGRKILLQTDADLNIRGKGDSLLIEGKIRFQEKEGKYKEVTSGRLLMELDGEHVGLIHTKEIPILEGEWEGDTLTLPKRRIGEVIALFMRANVTWEESLQKAAAALQQGRGLESYTLTSEFHGQLLPYQQIGVDWILFLQKWGFGALLSDEMGLGKTVQVVAFFSQLRTNLPILVVAPTSLLFNWQHELSRFWPKAKVYVHSGPDRIKKWQNSMDQVVLTSYALCRIDQELFEAQEFEVIALDESQMIKSANSQVALAICRFQARFKIAISGTPVENRPEELWSQFRFLMPDLLGERSAFLSSSPEALRRRIKPFLLRRRKEDVQIELPEKIDRPVWIDFTETQKILYNQTFAALKGGLLHKVQAEGFSAHRMEVLEAILRLRQICADPRLIDGRSGGGGKAEMLLVAAEELVRREKKAILFSQFTSFLRLIEKDLQAAGLESLYLDGSTPEKERGEIVRQFQEEDRPYLFLLSLKAGGIGLNLTAAESVFLLDPWWNEAVERQAIDRAHRIGQKKTLFVHRYLTPHSIEDKMLAMKAKKTAAAEALLGAEGDAWSPDDLMTLFT